MTLNENELALLEKMGSVGMRIAECAIALEKDVFELKNEMKNKDSAAFKAYCKGYLTSIIKLRESVAELAYRGSTPSQKMLSEMMGKSDIKTD